MPKAKYTGKVQYKSCGEMIRSIRERRKRKRPKMYDLKKKVVLILSVVSSLKHIDLKTFSVLRSVETK